MRARPKGPKLEARRADAGVNFLRTKTASPLPTNYRRSEGAI